MGELIFLDLDRVLRLHQALIERYGGEPGVRDTGLLESAIAQPQAGFGGEYLHEDVYMMAAAICSILCRITRFTMETSGRVRPARLCSLP
jgi:prophage maintenance system killer protein